MKRSLDTDQGFALVKLDSKGRPSVPAAMRKYLGWHAGQSVVVHTEGPSRLVFETQDASLDAAQDRIHSILGNPAAGDAAAEARRERDLDIALSDAAFERRSQVPSDPAVSEARGKALLASLGLD